MKRKAGDIKMLLKIISTGSQAGNSYALIADNGERLLLDAGATYACLVWNIGLKKADRWKRRVMSNGLFQEMPEMSKGGMSMEIRTIEEVRVYVLILNTFGAAEEGEVVAISNDYNKLVSWYKDQFNPEGEYRENGWTKTFRKGSLIEYNNPCSSLELNDTYPYGHGIHDEWIPIEQFYSLGNRYNVI